MIIVEMHTTFILFYKMDFYCTLLTFKQSRNQGKIGTSLDSTFTGKETDCETGFSYFGARYYDPTLLTSWTAVDPMSDDCPNMSPYHYCHWNPIRLTDLTGMCDDEWQVASNGVVTRISNKGGEHIQTVSYESSGETKTYSGKQYHKIFSDLREENWHRTNWGGNCWYSNTDGVDKSSLTSHKKALVNVFYDMAKNTDIEWALYAYGSNMVLGHLQKYNGPYSGENHAPALYDLGCHNRETKGTMIHSHPNTPDENEMTISIGWNNDINKRSGDSKLRRDYPNMAYHVFMKKSNHLVTIPMRGMPSKRNSTSKELLYKLFNLK